MKIILDIEDNKVAFVLELLNNLPFVKAKTITPEKAQLLEEVKESVENLNLFKRGELKARPAKDLIDEL
jgi:nicotinamide mononucleotide adenylyltransferase